MAPFLRRLLRAPAGSAGVAVEINVLSLGTKSFLDEVGGPCLRRAIFDIAFLFWE